MRVRRDGVPVQMRRLLSTLMDAPRLSLTEFAVLGVLAEGPSHGFAIARELAPAGSIGRVLTVRRSLAYRAIDRLVAEGLARPTRVEAGDAGPQRRVHRITPAGRRLLTAWLERPVRHLREMRLEFRLKLVLIERAGPLAAGPRARTARGVGAGAECNRWGGSGSPGRSRRAVAEAQHRRDLRLSRRARVALSIGHSWFCGCWVSAGSISCPERRSGGDWAPG